MKLSEKHHLIRLGSACGLMSLAVLFAALQAAPLSTAFGAKCPRGTLDKRYCDRNGDLVADAPMDKSKWVDPKVIVFAYTPVEDPSVYKKVWDGFLRHMSKTTDKRVQFFAVQSNARNWKPCVRAGCTWPVSIRAAIPSRSTARALCPLP